MTADDRDLAVTQARDTAALARGLIDGLACATCDGTGLIREPDLASSAWFPKRPWIVWCRDCDGTGRDPIEETNR